MPQKTTKLDKTISLIVGDEAIPLVNLIRGKSNVSEFKIAESLKLEINEVRNILYKLNEKNLIEFTRKKDKKKGWYIYYWTFNDKMLNFALKKYIKQRIEKLKERLNNEEEGAFFICDNKCVRVDFDKAMDFQFSCPECGELMHQEDNQRTKENLGSEIERLSAELEELEKVVQPKKAMKAEKKTSKKEKSDKVNKKTKPELKAKTNPKETKIIKTEKPTKVKQITKTPKDKKESKIKPKTIKKETKQKKSKSLKIKPKSAIKLVKRKILGK